MRVVAQLIRSRRAKMFLLKRLNRLVWVAQYPEESSRFGQSCL
jgi:hypothetical protein